MTECCMCPREASASTAVVNGEWFAVCRAHLRLWQKTPEDISLREWCRRITQPAVDGVRHIGKTYLCDLLDSTAVGE